MCYEAGRAQWIWGSKWTICSGEREVVQHLALPRSYDTRLYLHWLSERIVLFDRASRYGRSLMFIDAMLPVSDTLLIALKRRGGKINRPMQRSFADCVFTSNFCPCATGGPICRSSPQEAFDERWHPSPRNPMECEPLMYRFLLHVRRVQRSID